MHKFIAVLFITLNPLLAIASNIPTYFTPESNQEYISTLDHLRDILPKKGPQILLAGLASPYGILDIQPTRFISDDAKDKFANFNLGVVANAIFKADPSFSTALPNRVLCHQSTCKKTRINAINKFINESNMVNSFFKNNLDIDIVQRSNEMVFRINNAFITPSGILQYKPSKVAGFVPSAQVKMINDITQSPIHLSLVSRSSELRKIMATYNIIAITRDKDNVINVIFDGISNNHWGVTINSNDSNKPSIGSLNSLGFEYDDVTALSPTSFYYQTN